MFKVMIMATKTNAVRLVEAAGFDCQEAFYEYDENDLNGNHAAKAMDMPPEQVFKTLVARGVKTGINVFCIPVCCELDLKRAAKAAGDKNIELIAVKELLAITGYIRGGCSPIGMKKHYPTFIDETCQLYDKIAVSAGERGHQMLIPFEAILQLANANLADIIA
jgi:Cys-tRNA(Pro)/Cys-tRNA(Cys) deacylase